jgi:WD40 repeat protein
VRALAFIPEIPFALLSGSWDATIKMWDIRNGNHLWTLNDHCSDVYGITLHPDRPFVLSSCSRDTSIRTFIIDGFIQSLKINFLSTKNFNET